jgi:hypothetical protein
MNTFGTATWVYVQGSRHQCTVKDISDNLTEDRGFTLRTTMDLWADGWGGPVR